MSSRRVLGAVVATAVTLTVTIAPGVAVDAGFEWPSAAVPHPETVSADALPTVQINGVVWAQEIVGNTVYVGGNFTQARPAGSAPGQNEVARANFLAYDLTTGALLNSVVFDANGQVRTIRRSPDGSRIYVGGDFTTFGGQPRARIAAISTANNTLTGFAPSIGWHVYDIAPTSTTVYVGGNFTSVGVVARQRLAAFSLGGELLAWAPTADMQVTSIRVAPDGSKVALGGNFESINGAANTRGMAFVDAVTGAVRPMAAATVIRNGGESGAITSLNSDGQYLYGSGYTFGNTGGGFEGVFALNWSDGSFRWIADCHGDTYSVHAQGDVVYAVSHNHYCGNVGGFPEHNPIQNRRATAFTRDSTGTLARDRLGYNTFPGRPRPDLLNFFPAVNAGQFTGQFQGPWHVTGNGAYVVMGGEFTSINGEPQQGLARFVMRSLAPNDQGPMLAAGDYPINVWSDAAGRVTVNWRANDDRDDGDLQYRVYRRTGGSGDGTLLHQRVLWAPYWNRPVMTFTDTTATAGASYQYRVQVTDGYGNFANSTWTSVTVAGSGTRGSYLSAVLASQPDSFWRLDETSGSSVADRVGWREGTRQGGVAPGAASVLGTGRAATFSGGSGSFISTSAREYPTHTLSLEAWFRAAPGADGGLILGFNAGNTGAGSSAGHDRHLYMDVNGRIRFGVNPVNPVSIVSGADYRNNQWHHAVATLGPDGMQLYVDAVLVAHDPDTGGARTGTWGYWRIGGGSMDGFQGINSSTGRWFDGTLDEVAQYGRVLSGGEVANHYAAAGFDPPNVPPTADFTPSITAPSNGRTVVFDAGASSDADGSIVSYRWTFGDGSAPVTVGTTTVTHEYPAIATYTASLTVTDDDGATDTVSKQVTTVNPTALPVWTDSTIGPMRVDQPFSDRVAATGQPPPTYAVISGALPPGIVLETSTGSITGTPTTVGPFSVTIRASNGIGTPITTTIDGFVNPLVDPVLVLDVAANAGSPAAGSPLTVSGVGLRPGTVVQLSVDGQAVGSGTVAGDTSIAITSALPARVATGVHHLSASATSQDGFPVSDTTAIVVDWNGVLGAAPNGAGYRGVTPQRVLDTRLGAGKVAAGGEHRLALDGSWGVPGDAVALVLNVTATEPEDPGFLTVYPCGTPRPIASALNYMAAETVPNLVVVALGALRDVCIFSLASSHVVADLNGYFAPSATARIAGQAPVRLVDTRDSVKPVGGQVLEVQVIGDGRAPIGAQSAVVNVTVTEPEAAGFLTLFPCDQPMPTASNVNYAAGQTVANQAFVTLSGSGTACVFTLSPSHVVLDLNAWFRPGESPELVSLAPVRVLDTRDGSTMQPGATPAGKLAAGETRQLELAGPGGIAGAAGFAVNTTITEPEGPGFVTFFPCGEELPLASSINFGPGQVVANHTTAMVGAGGATCIFASTATHVIVDVEGAYIAMP